MNKEQFIISRFKKILRESLQEKADSLMTKLNYDKETELYPENEFDYVEEEMNEGETCEECGGEIKEGECNECGYGKDKEIMELGGMDDGHPKFGDKNLSKLTKKQMEDLLYGMEDEDEDDEDYKPRKRNKRDDDEEFELELDESWYSHDEYERMRDLGDEDELRAYQDKLVSGGKKEKAKKEGDDEEFDFELDLSEEELDEKLYGKQRKLDRNKNGRIDKEDFKMLRKQQDETEQLYEVEFDVEMGEGETYEGNAFTGALAKAKKEGEDTFEVDGKKYDVKESILYTESDLIDLIENIVVEETKFKKSEPKGYREYERAHKADKKENNDYLKSVAKKMTDYLKGMSDEGSKYEMKKTKKFPTENGGMKKGNRKKYTPSDAVDDYIDAFSYPGQTNLRYDEIKPNDEWIEDLLKGSSRTGNAQVDKDGNALGNVVPSKTGEKFYKNYEENLYGHEQADASYKRYSQPVDVAGDKKETGGSLKSKRGKKTAQSVLNKLEESVETKKDVKLNEEFDRIQSLMGYNRKTQ